MLMSSENVSRSGSAALDAVGVQLAAGCQQMQQSEDQTCRHHTLRRSTQTRHHCHSLLGAMVAYRYPQHPLQLPTVRGRRALGQGDSFIEC